MSQLNPKAKAFVPKPAPKPKAKAHLPRAQAPQFVPNAQRNAAPAATLAPSNDWGSDWQQGQYGGGVAGGFQYTNPYQQQHQHQHHQAMMQQQQQQQHLQQQQHMHHMQQQGYLNPQAQWGSNPNQMGGGGGGGGEVRAIEDECEEVRDALTAFENELLTQEGNGEDVSRALEAAAMEAGQDIEEEGLPEEDEYLEFIKEEEAKEKKE